MLKVDLIHSHIRPRQTCLEAANQVSDLLRLYRQRYALRSCQLVLAHILLSVCIVHLLHSTDSQVSLQNLVEGLQALEDISTCHYFGARSFKIVYALAQTWNIPFPDDMMKSRILLPNETLKSAVDSPEPMYTSHSNKNIDTRLRGVPYAPLSTTPQPEMNRRESLSMFARPTRKAMQLPSHAGSSQGADIRSIQPQQRGSASHIAPPFLGSSASPTEAIPASLPPNPTNGSAETLFWTPLPGMGVPILPRSYQVSPMDLDSVLGSADEWDKFSRDGFKMSEVWQPDTMPTYSNGQGQAYSHSEQGHAYAGNPEVQYNANDMTQEAVHHGGQEFAARWWNGEGNVGGIN
jgi:hypothetical protein